MTETYIKSNKRPKSKDLQIHVVAKYASRWEELGALLQLDQESLSSIDRDGYDSRKKCTEMLQEWIRNSINCTWDQLLSAIDDLSPLPENKYQDMNQSSMGWNVPAGYQSDCNENESKKSLSLRNVIYEICEKIQRVQLNKYHDSKMSAVDIACGYHSYLFDIAEWYKLVIPITLGPYSRNQAKIFKIEEHGDVNIVKMPTNLFNSPFKSKQKFSRVCAKNDVKFSLVVVAPMDNENKLNSVNEILKILSQGSRCFRDGSVMLYLRPLEVDGNDISEYFTDWEPESTEWILKKKYDKRTVKCGDLNCKFEFKTFDYEKKHLETVI